MKALFFAASVMFLFLAGCDTVGDGDARTSKELAILSLIPETKCPVCEECKECPSCEVCPKVEVGVRLCEIPAVIGKMLQCKCAGKGILFSLDEEGKLQTSCQD